MPSRRDKTTAAISVFNHYAELYQSQFMHLDTYYESFDHFCEQLPHKSSLLEVACGPGNITQYIQQKRPDSNILATDLAQNMLELAKQNVPEASFQLLDCNDLDQINDSFNGIINGFGLPYLSKEDSIQFIIHAFQKLKESGLLYLSTMEAPYSLSGYQLPSTGKGPQAYIHYHERDYLLSALKKTGFEVIYIETFPTDKEHIQDLVIISQKIK